MRVRRAPATACFLRASDRTPVELGGDRDRRLKAASQIHALLASWLTIDLLGKSRRTGERGSGTLTTIVFTQGFLSYLFAALAFEDVDILPFVAGTLSVVAGFTALALLGEIHDQLGHPADRDFVLATPIRKSTLVAARAGHVLSFLGLFSFGLALAPAVLTGFKTGTLVHVALFFAAAVVLSASVVAAIQLPVLLVQRTLGRDAAASLSALLRAVLLGAGFLAILLGFRAMHHGPQLFPGGSAVLRCLPPYWYARALVGPGDSGPWALLALGFPLVVLASLSLVALLPERRTAGRPRREGTPLSHLGGLLPAGSRGQRGLLLFVLALLARERSFRLRALPLLGLPAAGVVLGLRADADARSLSFFLGLVHHLPLAYLPFLLFFLPYAEDWQAAWMVEASLGNPIQAGRRAAALAFAALLIPVQLLLFAVDASYRPLGSALITTVAALGLAWALLPVLCGLVRALPFSQPPDDLAPPGDIGGPAAVGIGATLAGITLETIPLPWRGAVAVAVLVAGAVAVRVPRP